MFTYIPMKPTEIYYDFVISGVFILKRRTMSLRLHSGLL